MSAAPHAVFFPSTGLQVMTALIHFIGKDFKSKFKLFTHKYSFIGITVITHCLSRRLQHESLTIQGIRTMPWPRLAVILMFCDSWLFMITSALLSFSLGSPSDLTLQAASLSSELGSNIPWPSARSPLTSVLSFTQHQNSSCMPSLVRAERCLIQIGRAHV